MKGGLKEYWGLSEPVVPSSSSAEQAKQFRSSFNNTIAGVNRSLQYTAANAAPAAHDSLGGHRDNVYAAYQAVVGSVDPANPSPAQGNIDRVLSAVGKLSTTASSLQRATEQSLNAWKARQPELNTASDQVLQLEEQNHQKAPILRKVIDTIQAMANERRWSECLQSLDQFMPKLAGIGGIGTQQATDTPQLDKKKSTENGVAGAQVRITTQQREAARRWFAETEQKLQRMAEEFGVTV